MGFDEATKRMELLAVHPGVTVDEVKANTEFELIIPSAVTVTGLPTPEEIRLLHEEIDPSHFVIR
jgi:glutaconate CoA-transferase subunit B